MNFVYSLDSLLSSRSIAKKVDTIGKNVPAIHQIQKGLPLIRAIYAGIIPAKTKNQKLLIKKSILLPKINCNRAFESKKNNNIPAVFNNNNPQFVVFIRIYKPPLKSRIFIWAIGRLRLFSLQVFYLLSVLKSLQIHHNPCHHYIFHCNQRQRHWVNVLS